jgi:predicted component of type VI protein secretion system
MRSLLRSALALFALGATVIGCNKPAAPTEPAPPTDVTLHVPGMN